jgi:hypothetical protein
MVGPLRQQPPVKHLSPVAQSEFLVQDILPSQARAAKQNGWLSVSEPHEQVGQPLAGQSYNT